MFWSEIWLNETDGMSRDASSVMGGGLKLGKMSGRRLFGQV